MECDGGMSVFQTVPIALLRLSTRNNWHNRVDRHPTLDKTLSSTTYSV